VSLLTTTPDASTLDQHYQNVERAPAELHRPALGNELTAVWQNTEAAKFDRRWCFGGIHKEQW
jgi:hypothetical protein